MLFRSWDTLEDARQTLLGFYIALNDVPPATMPLDWAHPEVAKFRAAMEDDFDTPAAFTLLHELRREVNRSKSAELAGVLKLLGGTIGLLQDDPAAFIRGAASDALDIDALVTERNAAKKSREFGRADAIRLQLDAAGIVLEDKPGGVTLWRRK